MGEGLGEPSSLLPSHFLSAHIPAGWHFTGRSAFGGPREEILRRIEAFQPDLVLLGTHGRSGFERLTLGSVAESVVRGCHSNVLVVPPAAAREGLTTVPVGTAAGRATATPAAVANAASVAA